MNRRSVIAIWTANESGKVFIFLRVFATSAVFQRSFYFFPSSAVSIERILEISVRVARKKNEEREREW